MSTICPLIEEMDVEDIIIGTILQVCNKPQVVRRMFDRTVHPAVDGMNLSRKGNNTDYKYPISNRTIQCVII